MIEIQELYIACEQEGDGYFEVGKYEEALSSFVQAQKVLKLFMKDEKIVPDSYLWGGMQTHHWSLYLSEAGCLCRLGKQNEAKEKINKAYYIIRNPGVKILTEIPTEL